VPNYHNIVVAVVYVFRQKTSLFAKDARLKER